jgi:hypothetical protein
MPTRLSKPVVRVVEVAMRSTEYRNGFVASIEPDGVHLKPPRGRWSKALYASWADVMLVAAQRRAEEIKQARAAKRRARKMGL